MSIKEFFKPTIKKIIISVILSIFLFSSFTHWKSFENYSTVGGPNQIGFPFAYHAYGCWPSKCVDEFYLTPFFIDLIIWFIISYLISSLSIKKRK